MENHLINPKTNIRRYNNVKKTVAECAWNQKSICWEQKTKRIKIFIESRGHNFIKYDQGSWYYEGLPPMNIRQLRLYYDRQVYKERKYKIANWSQLRTAAEANATLKSVPYSTRNLWGAL